jgi:hypothetical protein
MDAFQLESDRRKEWRLVLSLHSYPSSAIDSNSASVAT